eukprot:2509500-Rhodomonas_salina.1
MTFCYQMRQVVTDVYDLVDNLRSHLSVLFGVPPTLITCKVHTPYNCAPITCKALVPPMHR